MNRLQLMFLPVLLVTLVTACSDPLVMIPGSSLSGDIKPAPALWTSVPGTIQLEMRPSDPYSVNIWAAGIGANLYVATRDAKWMQFIEDDPAVRVRLDGVVHELVASKVTDRAELMRVIKRYAEKYDVDEADGFVNEGTAYRLEHRQKPD